MNRLWSKIRFTVRAALFPLICFQFIRTLLLPNPFDVFVLFLFFLLYLGFIFNFY